VLQRANTGLPHRSVTLAIDPTAPSTLYAGTDVGPVGQLATVFKSTDGASTWSASVNTGLPDAFFFDALAIAPTTPTTLHLASGTYGVFSIQ